MLLSVTTGLDRVDFLVAMDLSGWREAKVVLWESGSPPSGLPAAELADILRAVATEIERPDAAPTAS